jgi:hypothetical protein
MQYEAGLGGIFAGKITGNTSIVVAESMAEFGRARIGLVTPGGILTVDTADMPLGDAIKVAAGLGCNSC